MMANNMFHFGREPKEESKEEGDAKRRKRA